MNETTKSSGNVFADMGRPNPETLLLKSRLTQQIERTIDQNGWTQTQAAEILGINQSDVSNLVRGKRLSHYSVEKLLHFLALLGYQVTITIDPAKSSDPTSESKKPQSRVSYALEPTQTAHEWRDVSQTDMTDTKKVSMVARSGWGACVLMSVHANHLAGRFTIN